MAFTLPGTALISSWGVAEEAAEVLMDGRQLVSAAVPQRFLLVLRPPCSIWKARLAAVCGWRADDSMLVLRVEMKVWRVAKYRWQQMGPLIRPPVSEAAKVRRNEEKKTLGQT